MDYYLNTIHSMKIRGITTVWRKNSAGTYYDSTTEMDKYNWVYGKITLYHNDLKDLSNTQIEATIIHEMMHVYGAKHTTDKLSIMCTFTDGRTATTLTADANQLLINKYS